jgi:5,10-methylenetetrahydromethanopterin reductase
MATGSPGCLSPHKGWFPDRANSIALRCAQPNHLSIPHGNGGEQEVVLGDAPVKQLAERARFAESCGFDTVWLADERFYREVYSSLVQIALETSHVLLGPCVTDPFARHPALTAMAIATLDEIAEGRVMLGIGAGVSGFSELGIVPRKSPRAIREAITLIRALLRGEQVDMHGDVISFLEGRLGFNTNAH